jgi:hypothetical protein
MATNYEAIRALFDSAGVRYLVEPRSNSLMFGTTGASGQHYMIGLLLTDDGVWLQLRTAGFLTCPPGHPNILPVLQLLGGLNYQYRSIKYGWDPNDGEIAVFADLLIADTQPSADQVFGLIGFFLRLLDEGHPRLLAAIQQGKEPAQLPKVPAPEELV